MLRKMIRAGVPILAIGLLLLPAGAANATPGKNVMRVWMFNTGADSDARARATLFTNGYGDRFTVKAFDLAVGSYDLSVNGSVVGTFTVKNDDEGGTTGKIRFGFKHGTALTFDPHGATLDISQSGTVMLTTIFPMTASDIANTDFDVDLVNSGVIPGATGNADFKIRNGRMDFEVEVEGLPAGDYQLRADGAVVATFTVVLKVSSGLEVGDVQLSTNADDSGELALSFDPRGRLIEVTMLDGTVLLSATFPTAAP